MADLSQMLLQAKLDETAVAAVEVGQKAQVRMQAYPDQVFDGTVHTVALASTDDRDGSKFFKTEVLLKTGGKRVLAGLNGDVDIETKRHRGVLKVPTQAVVERSIDDLPTALQNAPEVNRGKTMATVVYRCVKNKAVVTPVKIGPSDVTHTIILSGLTEGDPVIVGPYKVLESIKHDQAVKPEAAGTSTTKPTTAPTTKPATRP